MLTVPLLKSVKRCLLLATGLSALGCASLAPSGSSEDGLTLVSNGRSPYRIVVPADASPSIRYGARELQNYFREMTGVELPIVSDLWDMGSHEIILGNNAHLAEIGLTVDFDKLGWEGYTLRTVGPHLVIAGGPVRGGLYGCYALLEDHLGCRWFAPDCSRIPRTDLLVVPPLDETVVPALEYREPFVVDCFDGDWCARNRVNSSQGSLEERHGGKITYFGFVHTFNTLVPPEKYFGEHPEYFSEINGERVGGRTQLCCTNEEVIQLCIDGVRQWMEEHPEATVFSVSQNDWYNYCQCEKCQALAEKEGTQMAPVLALVNRVAEAVADDYPDKVIDTLAYQWTRKAPRTMRPRPNVIVRLCSIECCFTHPLATCDGPQNTAFRKDAEEWAKVCNRLWVWNYTTDFAHYFLPYPNRSVLAPNVRFFIDHNVTGIFEQDTYTTLNGEFSHLGGYVMAKLLWNPDYGVDRAIDEFLDGYYGPAAPYLRQYIDMLEKKVADDNIHFHIFSGPIAPYLTDEILDEADRLFDKAEEAVKGMPGLEERVRIQRLCPTYARIERMKPNPDQAFLPDHDAFAVRPNPALSERIEWFLDTCGKAGVARINEWGYPPSEYRERHERYLEGEKLEPRDAAGLARPGKAGEIQAEYYEFEKTPARLDDLKGLSPKKTLALPQIGTDPRERDHDYGLVFRGWLDAPRDGVYTFTIESDDGSRLAIGDDDVVNHDGSHAMTAAHGRVALRKGLHPLRIEYFQGTGDSGLKVRVTGPGFQDRELGGELLRLPE